MNDYNKIMESISNLKWLILSIIVDIVLLIVLGAWTIELLFN